MGPNLAWHTAGVRRPGHSSIRQQKPGAVTNVNLTYWNKKKPADLKVESSMKFREILCIIFIEIVLTISWLILNDIRWKYNGI